MQEQALFEKVKLSVSNPCNTFIVFNQWDVVEKKRGADRVKQQHLERVNEILVETLHIYNTEMAQKRTFFLSAEEALTMCDMQHQTSPNAQSGGKAQQVFLVTNSWGSGLNWNYLLAISPHMLNS